MVKYAAKLKGESPEILSEDDIGTYFHFFNKEEIDYVIELPDDIDIVNLISAGNPNTTPKKDNSKKASSQQTLYLL
jgi:hypothetical protein